MPFPDIIDGAPIIPPLYNIHGSSGQNYIGNCTLDLIAELHETWAPDHIKVGFFQSIFQRPRLRTYTFNIPHLVVYDPRLINRMVIPESKEWKSAPGTVPCEYDFEVKNSVVGPGDDLEFAYRVALSSEAEKLGTRIHYIRYTLKEVHQVGDNRRFYVKASTDLLKWEQKEYEPSPPKSSTPKSPLIQEQDIEIEFTMIKQPNTKDGLLRDRYGRGGGTFDGLYAEAEASLRIPSSSKNGPKINPSTPKTNDTNYESANVEIKHVLRVDVEFINILHNPVPDKLSFECVVVVGCVGRREIIDLLDHHIEIVPSLDYEKICGSEVWIPVYREIEDAESPLYDKFRNCGDESDHDCLSGEHEFLELDVDSSESDED